MVAIELEIAMHEYEYNVADVLCVVFPKASGT